MHWLRQLDHIPFGIGCVAGMSTFSLALPLLPSFSCRKGVPGVDVSVGASLSGGLVLPERLAALDVVDAMSIC